MRDVTISGKKIPLLLILAAALLAAILVFFGIFFLFKSGKEGVGVPPSGRAIEEIIKDLTAPATQEIRKVSEEVMRKLTAPKKGFVPEVPEEILRSLTAPQ